MGKPIGSSALAAAVAWLIARHVAGHAGPFFAPVAALMVSGLTVGQRALRALELTVGQALGILCADLLVNADREGRRADRAGRGDRDGGRRAARSGRAARPAAAISGVLV